MSSSSISRPFKPWMQNLCGRDRSFLMSDRTKAKNGMRDILDIEHVNDDGLVRAEALHVLNMVVGNGDDKRMVFSKIL